MDCKEDRRQTRRPRFVPTLFEWVREGLMESREDFLRREAKVGAHRKFEGRPSA
jgi:hypothetical protein